MLDVDIMIPAYNAADYLPAALDSVIAQTFKDWRIIIVDDGSTDNTAEVVARYLDQLGAQLKYIKQSNLGIAAARNVVLKNTSAEFIALLDADDVWLPSRLSESLRSFDGRPQVGLSYGLIARIDPKGAVIELPAGTEKHIFGRIAPDIYMRRVHLPSPTITFRKECIDKAGLFDEDMRATEDRDLWFRIALHYEVAFVPRILAQYRVSPNSMSRDPDRMLDAQLKFIEKHYGTPGCGWLARRSALSTVYKEHAETRCAHGKLQTALRSSLRGFMFDPLNTDNDRTLLSLLLRNVGLKR